MVEQATIRQNTWTALSTLIEVNLPTYSFNSEAFEYVFVSEMPNKDVVLPAIELGSARGSFITVTMDGATGDIEIEIEIKFYAKEEHGKKAIEVAQDDLMNIFIGNIPTFIDTDKLVPTEDFWVDNPVSPIDINNQVINTATSIVRFRLG